LLFATLITLVLIPSVYKLFASLGAGFQKLGRKKKKHQMNTTETSETIN
jgi:Flp pilus assembly pilin Flp